MMIPILTFLLAIGGFGFSDGKLHAPARIASIQNSIWWNLW